MLVALAACASGGGHDGGAASSSGGSGSGSGSGGGSGSGSSGGSGSGSGSGGGSGSGSGGGSSSGGGDARFEACLASLTPLCRAHEMDTAEKMQTPCKATEYVAIPLTSGGLHGPITVEGGPHGARIDWNQGAGSAFVNPVNLGELVCLPIGIDSFQEPAAVTELLKNTRDLDASLYTIFRPACMREGETYPVITWANGTCGLTHGYAVLLGTIASHGFVIVASNSTWTATIPTSGVQLRALDYARSLNDDPASVLFRRLDLSRVGAMGHSQGAAATAAAATDARVKAVIFWNSGASSAKPFLDVAGDRDIGSPTASTLAAETEAAAQPGAWVYHHAVLQTGGIATGHLVLMEQPERVWELAVAWWKWRLNGDPEAKKMFVGDRCGLCERSGDLEYGHNRLLR